ncbi:MAG: two-component sensor histidine kinase [Solirubrobacterales bacterium]|nr:two-component sensor histidine kinase [Solirubrobacterales bacterium]
MSSSIVEKLLGAPPDAPVAERRARWMSYGAAPALERPPRWLGYGVAVLLLAVALIELPMPALHGDGLAGTIGLVALAAGLAILVFGRASSVAVRTAVALVIGLSSALLAQVQEDGIAILGCYVAVAMAARSLPWRAAVLVAVPVVVAVNAIIIAAGPDEVAVTLGWTNFGFLSAFVLAYFGRIAQERHQRTRELLAEAQHTRDAQAEAAMLAERGRIAREMHDVLAHSLSALTVQLEGARLLAHDRGADPEVERALERSLHHARTGLAEAREAIEALRGDGLPGPERLRELTDAFQVDGGVACELEVEGEPRELSSQARLALYRTGQEALTNVRKHADADRVEVRLRYEPGGTTLTVADHGAESNGSGGSPLAETGSGYGVSGMRERAELLGGRLSAAPTADGFRVELWLPVEAEAG